MIQKLLAYFRHNKYRLTIFILLAAATVFSAAIWRVRAEYTRTGRYEFLIWNLFLAWIPFLISYFIYTIRLSRRQIYVVVPLATIFWLIFFPNAPYLLTDFQHLAVPSKLLPVWYDVLMLIWFAFTGVLLGVVSLFLMQEVIRREFGRWLGWTFVAIVAALSSTGIYLGRFLRWNSWDVFNDPKTIAYLTIKRALDPTEQLIGFIGLFTTFFLFLYITLYAFGHLFVERQRDRTE